MTIKVAFIYVDTNGLHKMKSGMPINYDNIDRWARLLGIYYEICERKGNKLVSLSKNKIIINPNYELDKYACKFNGFTDEYVKKEGIPISEALLCLKTDLKGVGVIVGHNLEFHLRAIQAECFRDEKTLIEFKSQTLIDLIEFNHEMEYPKLKTLTETILKTDFKLKSRYGNVTFMKKIFEKLYDDFEKKAKN